MPMVSVKVLYNLSHILTALSVPSWLADRESPLALNTPAANTLYCVTAVSTMFGNWVSYSPRTAMRYALYLFQLR